MILAALLNGLLLGPPTQATPAPPAPLRFVVLGHIRGDDDGRLNPRFLELVERVRAVEPELIVLTGDIIWGDVHTPNPDPLDIAGQWEAVDSVLAKLGVPVLRVPGNHDINDLVTRDVYRSRYGAVPSVVRVGGHRFVLLSSAWIPEDGDSRKNPFVAGRDLDSAQVEFLRRELTGPREAGRVFVFLHHLLWWEPSSGPWWREVHPILAQGGVDAVFSGDYGPLKFSHARRDGIAYYQSSIETAVDLEHLRARVSSRVLSSQFDNWLLVTVSDTAVDVAVRTVSEISSGEFTAERYAAVVAPGEPEPLLKRAWAFVRPPRRLAALFLLIGVCFVGGFLTGRFAAART